MGSEEPTPEAAATEPAGPAASHHPEMWETEATVTRELRAPGVPLGRKLVHRQGNVLVHPAALTRAGMAFRTSISPQPILSNE